MEKEKLKPVTVKLSKEQYNELTQLSLNYKMGVSTCIRWIISEYLEKRRKDERIS